MSNGAVIVGASLAGVRTALDLRKEGYEGPITLIGDELAKPYDRPPLSKGYLAGEVTSASLSLCLDEDISNNDINLITGVAAEKLNTEQQRVGLSNGDSVGYDRLVVATGASCLRPPWYRPIAGVHELRTVDDAEALRVTLQQVRSLVVVGGGFIGTEVAATARSMGLHVTMVLRESAPLVPVLGDKVAEAISALHKGHGVNIRPHSDVEAFLGEDSVTGIRLSDGTVIAAEAVLVAVGVKPQVEWLEGTDLYHPRGVKTDRYGRAGVNIWAAGDVVQGAKGHWATAISHAKAVALDITGKTPPLKPISVPDYFWSDQYTHKLQVLGSPDPATTLSSVAGKLEEMSFVGVYGQQDRVTGALLIDRAKNLGQMRQLVGLGASLETCQEKVR